MSVLESVKSNQFTYTKLSPDEQKARGILGRLTGIIASTKNPTRNGRSYSKELWENVFNSDLMQEKIRTRCVLGELGHPADRSEIDIEKIAICLAETPKCGEDGNLYGVFDILDTPNGRILKTLCDYGTIIGISSRGQGDLIQDYQGNESVDPDTYDCECFDAVLVPAVKEARMKYIKEGLDLREYKLKKALNESFKNASDEDKKVMKETLNNLDIKLNEEALTEPKSIAEEIEDDAYEAAELGGERIYCDKCGSKLHYDDNGAYCPDCREKEVTDESLKPTADNDNEQVEVDIPEVEEVPADNVEEISDGNNEQVESEVLTVDSDLEPKEDNFSKEDVIATAKDVVETVKDVVDADEVVEEEIDKAVEEKIEEIFPEENNDNNSEDDINSEEISDENIDNEEVKETDEIEDEEVNDVEDESVVESLMETLKVKTDLENEVKLLNEKLAVSNAKVDKLVEECDRYKNSLSRLAELAKNSKDLKAKVSSLTESLSGKEQELKEKDNELTSQKVRIARLIESKKQLIKNSNSINESVDSKDQEIKTLNESLNEEKTSSENKLKVLNEKLELKEKESNEKIVKLTEDLNKATTIKESYKKLANKAVNKYIDVKALMLGMTANDIKRKLGESYTIEDVDQVCEDLKVYGYNISKLPIPVDRKVSVRVSESVKSNLTTGKKVENEDDEVDEALLRIANI